MHMRAHCTINWMQLEEAKFLCKTKFIQTLFVLARCGILDFRFAEQCLILSSFTSRWLRCSARLTKPQNLNNNCRNRENSDENIEQNGTGEQRLAQKKRRRRKRNEKRSEKN